MLSKTFIPTLLVAAVLAGCQSPVQPMPTAPRQPIAGIKAQNGPRYVELHVPASIKRHVDDYLARIDKERAALPGGYEMRVENDLTVQVSSDGGKTFQQGGSLYAQVRPAQDGGLIVPLYLAPGTQVQYFLQSKVRLTGDGVYGRSGATLKEYPMFYVSDFGRNYRATL